MIRLAPIELSPRITGCLNRLSAKDVQAMLDRWEDEANELILSGNLIRARYVDAWRAGFMS